MEWYWIVLIIFGWAASGIWGCLWNWHQQTDITVKCFIGLIIGGSIIGVIAWLTIGILGLNECIKGWDSVIIKKKS